MKNIVVIGGGSGVGAALVSSLKQNNQIFGSFNNSTIQAEINVHPFKLNVLEEEWDLSSLPDEIHGLVYCPGSINLMPFKRIKPEDFEKDYKLQVIGAIKIIQSLLEPLKKGKASIVFFSTVAVKMGYNFHSQVASSKGALEGLTKALAAEFAPTIRVNTIAPSLTDTPLAGRLLNNPEKKAAHGEKHPLKRVGEPEDIANAAEFLLSEKSSWITGQIIQVDGGISSLKV